MTSTETELPFVAVVDPRAIRRNRMLVRVAMWTCAAAVPVLLVATSFVDDGVERGDVSAAGYLVTFFFLVAVLSLPVLGLQLRNGREIGASSWMFGVEVDGLRLAEKRLPDGHVLVPWNEVKSVRASALSPTVVRVRLTPVGTRRMTNRPRVVRWMLRWVSIPYPMRWSTMNVEDALVAVRRRAPRVMG